MVQGLMGGLGERLVVKTKDGRLWAVHKDNGGGGGCKAMWEVKTSSGKSMQDVSGGCEWCEV
jgi:hypothetical protein